MDAQARAWVCTPSGLSLLCWQPEPSVLIRTRLDPLLQGQSDRHHKALQVALR